MRNLKNLTSPKKYSIIQNLMYRPMVIIYLFIMVKNGLYYMIRKISDRYDKHYLAKHSLKFNFMARHMTIFIK